MVKVKRPHLNQGVGMVYDCFIFFNEFEQLNIRLHELNPIVDRFVLVESNQTFSGNMKPLYLQKIVNAGPCSWIKLFTWLSMTCQS